MNLKRVMNTEGLNWWTVVSGIGLNFVFTAFLFLTMTAFSEQGLAPWLYTVTMCVGAFLIPLITAYVCGRLADERYLTYALYPLVGFLILTVPGILFAGVFGALITAFGVLGAFNGANLVARRAMKRRREIYGPGNSEEKSP